MTIIKEITRDEPYLIINKPSGLPSAPLNENDRNNAFSIAAELFPELLNVTGRKEIEHGLLHRIDTETSGLLIIAATQDSYENLLQLQKENKIKKYYSALSNVDYENINKLGGFPSSDFVYCKNIKEYNLESYFRFFGEGRKSVRPVTKNSNGAALKKLGKPVLYNTNIKIVENSCDLIRIEACITNGFRHQVRCHLAWMGLPIIGDSLYNSNTDGEQLKFKASKIDINGKVFSL
ncbi:MAG: RNA pseudouridine synthase [Spirochaetia bacterium]|nr:RNA pseudouridine synthase [Spirochaetia bacterium]MDY4984855.1 RNA pseudouridine synthase [Treponema sp.]